jgi:uncharacterized protein YodC (DUF2158 family)
MAESQVTFQPGDTVQLVSGGPLMTVGSVPDQNDPMSDGMISCQWFDKGKKHEDRFYPAALKKAEKARPTVGAIWLGKK